MKGGPLSCLAGRLCQRREFQLFCGAGDAEQAAGFIRRVCRIESRAQFDHDQQARDRFHELVRKPFAYRRAA